MHQQKAEKLAAENPKQPEKDLNEATVGDLVFVKGGPKPIGTLITKLPGETGEQRGIVKIDHSDTIRTTRIGQYTVKVETVTISGFDRHYTFKSAALPDAKHTGDGKDDADHREPIEEPVAMTTFPDESETHPAKSEFRVETTTGFIHVAADSQEAAEKAVEGDGHILKRKGKQKKASPSTLDEAVREQGQK